MSDIDTEAIPFSEKSRKPDSIADSLYLAFIASSLSRFLLKSHLLPESILQMPDLLASFWTPYFVSFG